MNNLSFIKNNLINVNNMKLSDFLNFITQNQETFITNFDYFAEDLNNLDEEKFKMFYLKSSAKLKEKIIENEELYKKVILVTPNRQKKNLFDLSDSTIQIKILSYPARLKNINSDYYLTYLKKLSQDEFEKFTRDLDKSLFFNSTDDIKYYIIGKYKVSEENAKDFLNEALNKQKNLYNLLKLNTKIEYDMYNKFNFIIQLKEEDKNIIMPNDLHIDKAIFNNVNKRHLNNIIKKLFSINNSLDNYEIFILAINLYCIFGFDNTMKILNNSFTYINNISLEKIANTCFIDRKRQYRIDNQDRFISHETVAKAKLALMSNDITFFKDLFSNNNDQYINTFISNLKTENLENKTIEKHLREEINKRDNKLKKDYISNYIGNYKAYNPNKREDITSDELYNIFKDVDISSTELDNKGRPIINNNLMKFLLGNLKSNNDCLLRLIFNKQGIDLNDNLDLIINNFNKIQHIASESKSKLSIFSILDVIEINKILLYDIAPNEKDLSFITLAKIMKSQKYCNESKEHILNRTKNLYHNSKYKIASSIPSIGCNKLNGIEYKTLEFNNPQILVSGIDTESCLKVGGYGEDFLEYCLTSPHSIVVGLWDEDNNYYHCPFIRNGNTVYGNGIEPKPKDEKTALKLLEALKEVGNSFIGKSYIKEKIELVTITDLNLEKYLKNTDLSSISINEYLPIDKAFYSDYHKNEKTTYIISASTTKEPNHYIPKTHFYQERTKNYNYDITTERDNKYINGIINSIYYDNINFKNISEEKKLSLKRNYQQLDVRNFVYVIGNKDWFIAIDENTNILSCCLPYDKRAKIDYLNSFKNIKNEEYVSERKL